MVFGACITILTVDTQIAPVFVWVSAVVMLRELAVTSMRLVVAGKSGKVIAASFFGKLKTVSQIIAILVIFLEPLIAQGVAACTFLGPVYAFATNFFAYRVLSYVFMSLMAVTTVASGIDYMRAYMPLIDTNK